MLPVWQRVAIAGAMFLGMNTLSILLQAFLYEPMGVERFAWPLPLLLNGLSAVLGAGVGLAGVRRVLPRAQLVSLWAPALFPVPSIILSFNLTQALLESGRGLGSSLATVTLFGPSLLFAYLATYLRYEHP